MGNKGCIWMIVIFFAIVAIANCNDKKNNSKQTNTNSSYSGSNSRESTSTTSSYSSSSSSYSSSSSSCTQQKTREKTEEERLLDLYRGNSLSNGSQPYSSYYGVNSSNGNSVIIVNAPSFQDVLVIIKRNNSNGSVVRHAYIAKGCSYSFHLPAGTYQPFFYEGDSWCPTKRMHGGVTGGFLRNESFSKDYPQELPDYTELTYSLTATVNGNFSTKSSSESEMF